MVLPSWLRAFVAELRAFVAECLCGEPLWLKAFVARLEALVAMLWHVSLVWVPLWLYDGASMVLVLDDERCPSM